jgi:hypothetical protein
MLFKHSSHFDSPYPFFGAYTGGSQTISRDRNNLHGGCLVTTSAANLSPVPLLVILKTTLPLLFICL